MPRTRPVVLIHSLMLSKEWLDLTYLLPTDRYTLLFFCRWACHSIFLWALWAADRADDTRLIHAGLPMQKATLFDRASA